MSVPSLISIIVPVYNVEEYLPRCVDSLISQSYQKIEILLVDDGSPDKCGDICEEYAKKDKRVKVIHKKNGGLSDARNKGLDIAAGDFIMFVDSDDWIDEKTCEVVLNYINKYKVDIVSFGYVNVLTNGQMNKQITKKPRIITPSEGIKELIIAHDVINNFVCNKIFKKEVWRNVRFPIGKVYEDQGTTYKLFANANNIYVSDEAFYYYFRRDDSISAMWYKPHSIEARIQHWVERLSFLEKNYPENADAQKAQLLREAYIGLIVLEKDSEFEQIRPLMDSIIRKYKDEMPKLKGVFKLLILRYYSYILFYLYVKFKIR